MTAVGELLGLTPEPWMDDALCAQTFPDLFFPETGEKTAAPKAICALCDVRLECLRYALDRNERWGVYGGLSERERRRLKQRQSAARLAATRRRSA